MSIELNFNLFQDSVKKIETELQKHYLIRLFYYLDNKTALKEAVKDRYNEDNADFVMTCIEQADLFYYERLDKDFFPQGMSLKLKQDILHRTKRFFSLEVDSEKNRQKKRNQWRVFPKKNKPSLNADDFVFQINKLILDAADFAAQADLANPLINKLSSNSINTQVNKLKALFKIENKLYQELFNSCQENNSFLPLNAKIIANQARAIKNKLARAVLTSHEKRAIFHYDHRGNIVFNTQFLLKFAESCSLFNKNLLKSCLNNPVLTTQLQTIEHAHQIQKARNHYRLLAFVADNRFFFIALALAALGAVAIFCSLFFPPIAFLWIPGMVIGIPSLMSAVLSSFTTKTLEKSLSQYITLHQNHDKHPNIKEKLEPPQRIPEKRKINNPSFFLEEDEHQYANLFQTRLSEKEDIDAKVLLLNNSTL